MGVSRLNQAQKLAVFLDRDGTLNRAFWRDGVSVPPTTVREVEILPGVRSGLRRLKRAGFVLVVVSNQPDVARGKQTRQAVEAINAHLQHQLPLDEILCCYHDSPDSCACRKPAPGMLVDVAQRRGLHLARSFMIGDRATDIEAGRRAGCTTVLLHVCTGDASSVPADFEAADLNEAARIILRCRKERTREDLRR